MNKEQTYISHVAVFNLLQLFRYKLDEFQLSVQ